MKSNKTFTVIFLFLFSILELGANVEKNEKEVTHEFLRNDGTKQKISLMPLEVTQRIALETKKNFIDHENQLHIHLQLSKKLNIQPQSNLENLNAKHIANLNTALIHKLFQKSTFSAFPTPLPSTPVDQSADCDHDLGHGEGIDVEEISCKHNPSGIYLNFDWPLKPYLTCVKQQGKRGTCTVFGTIGAIETSTLKQYGERINLSEQALYYEGRYHWGGGGCANHTGDSFIAMVYFFYVKNNGYAIPYEYQWDYNPSWHRHETDILGPAYVDFSHSCDHYSEYCSDTPHQGKQRCSKHDPGHLFCDYISQVPKDHSGVYVTDWAELWNISDKSLSLKHILGTLASGDPIVLSFTATKGFLSAVADGVVSMSNTEKVGGHVVEAVGFITNEDLQATLPTIPPGSGGGYLIVKNSWGSCAGDGGYYYIPFDYVKKYSHSAIAVYSVRQQGQLPTN